MIWVEKVGGIREISGRAARRLLYSFSSELIVPYIRG